MPKRKPDPEWDHVYASNYRSTLLSGQQWLIQANALLHAADLLDPEVRNVWQHNMAWLKDQTLRPQSTAIFRIHFMLIAFAVENLLKGAIVTGATSHVRDEFERTGKLPGVLKSHDLFELAQKVSFGKSREDEDMLRRLSRAAIWSGRYPVPIDFRDNAGAEEFSDGEIWAVSYFSEDDPERLKEFVKRLKAHLGVREHI